MQPVVYLLVRIALTWLQYLERDTRAFAHGTQLVLVAGAAHCWAVVYALFVAVLARVARNNHAGHTSYDELLPWWVLSTERVAALAMVVWWLAGCLRLLVHMVEDDAKILPMTVQDTPIDIILRAARSPVTRFFLASAQAVSCTGLFLSVLLLCFSLLVLAGSTSVFEWGLVFVASSFALPLAALAVQRLLGLDSLTFGRAALAAATENAALGPQFCVILALMDIRDYSHGWTAPLFPAAAVMFTASIVACAIAPPRFEDDAVPPKTSELASSAAIDVIAVAALTLCFSMQSGWVMWILAAMLVVLGITCASLTMRIVRDEITQLLENIMPLRCEFNKLRPGPWREFFRVGTRAMVLASSVVAFWDVAVYAAEKPAAAYVPEDASLHSSTDASADYPHMDDDDYHTDYHDYHSAYHQDEHDQEHTSAPPMVMRWLPPDFPGESALMDAACEAFVGLELSMLKVDRPIMEHRTLVLLYIGPEKHLPTPRNRWVDALDLIPNHGHAKLFGIADSHFPTHLDKELCDKVMPTHAPLSSNDFADREVQAAYTAACSAWLLPHSEYYGHHDHHLENGYHEDGHDGHYGEDHHESSYLEKSEHEDEQEHPWKDAGYHPDQDNAADEGIYDPDQESEAAADPEGNAGNEEAHKRHTERQTWEEMRREDTEAEGQQEADAGKQEAAGNAGEGGDAEARVEGAEEPSGGESAPDGENQDEQPEAEQPEETSESEQQDGENQEEV